MQTIERTGNGSFLAADFINNINTPRNYQFFVRSTGSISFNLIVRYSQQVSFIDFSGLTGSFITLFNRFLTEASYVITAEISVVNYLPDMTVENFFAGVLKMFNLLLIK